MTRPNVTDLDPDTRDRVRRLAIHQGAMRAILHEDATSTVANADTWYSDDGIAVTVGDDGTDTVLVVAGAKVTMGETTVLQLVHRLLQPLAADPFAGWETKSAAEAIRTELERRAEASEAWA